MFLELFRALVKYFSPLNVFKYLTFRSAYAAVTALLIAFLFGPAIIEMLRRLRFGQSVRKDGPESHLAKTGTPTMGGILIILAVSVGVLLWADLSNAYVWIALGSLVGFGAIGFVDDWLKIKRQNSDGIPAWVKLAAQVIIASAAALLIYDPKNSATTMLYVPFIKAPVLDLGAAWIPIAVVYVVYWSNAVNLADGLDGLATGLTIMALIAFSVLTYVTGRPDWSAYLNIPNVKGASELTVFNLALLGACVGFLWFNAHPAEVFMGDVGSLALGGVLGVISLIVKKELLLLLDRRRIHDGGPVGRAPGWLLKITKGKRLFRMAPIHHHFELKGWKETKVVTRFWILGGLFAISGTLHAEDTVRGWMRASGIRGRARGPEGAETGAFSPPSSCWPGSASPPFGRPPPSTPCPWAAPRAISRCARPSSSCPRPSYSGLRHRRPGRPAREDGGLDLDRPRAHAPALHARASGRTATARRGG
jgi:phospho-N-acetylmuramoyl-pentapeptide-transferase